MWVEERREGRVLLKDEVWCGWIESLLLGQLRWLRLEQRGRSQHTGQFGATDCFLSLSYGTLCWSRWSLDSRRAAGENTPLARGYKLCQVSLAHHLTLATAAPLLLPPFLPAGHSAMR